MSLMNTTSERLRRANQLWHAYLTITGQRFELAQFLNDAALERQVIEGALVSGDQKLIGLAQDWLRDSGQAMPAATAARVMPDRLAPAAEAAAATAKPARYLRGVR